MTTSRSLARAVATLVTGACVAASSVLLAPAADAAPVTGRSCTATVTNAKPKSSGAKETVVVGTTAKASVTLTVHYKTKNRVFTFAADKNGSGRYTFDIGHPTPRYAVVVDVATSSRQTCSTTFTPQ